MLSQKFREETKISTMGSLTRPHFVIFPFMSQGHTIPLLHLARLLHHRSAAVTVVTTAGNSPPIRTYLKDINNISVIELPFPQKIDGVPQGIENTQNLPSMSCFLPFVISTKQMQKSFEEALEALSPPVSSIISDTFLGWTLESARKFHVPRFAFFGMGNFPCTMYQVLLREKPHAHTKTPDEPFLINPNDFPGLELTRNDFDPPFGDIEPSGTFVDFMEEQIIAMAMSRGVIVNSFHKLEDRYIDYWDNRIGPKAYCIGPLCLVEGPELEELERPSYLTFLDEKLAKGEDVLYVAFGTQAEVSLEQQHEIAAGLEQSKVNFLWVLRLPKGVDENFIRDFGSRVGDKGMIVSDWVDQVRILRHEGVKGFLSHCGWNSVLESISFGVPILAIPFMAEQYLNARFVAELADVGLRIMPGGGGGPSSVRGFVEANEVERAVRELMCGGERAVRVRQKVEELSKASREAMGEGGSSWGTLDSIISEICVRRD